MKISGPAYTWEVARGHKRTFGVVTLPFGEAREVIAPVRYNALRGTGEQRDVIEPHARKIRQAMESGDYTPTPVSANLRQKHKGALTIAGGKFHLDVDPSDQLPQTDGNHRFEGLERILKARQALVKAGGITAEEAGKAAADVDLVLKAPVTITIYFDGSARKDFINLQLGRSVDAAHMLSLLIQEKYLEGEYRLAWETARLLAGHEDSPFHLVVRFDSTARKGSYMRQVPISTLCSKGASDISTSLVGLARVAPHREPQWLAFSVVAPYKTFLAKAPDLVLPGKVLTPPSKGGGKGSSTMLIGLGVCLAYRMLVLDHDLPTDEDLDLLVACAHKHLDREVAGNFSGPVKRALMGEFAEAFLGDIAGEKHHAVPTDLLRKLSCSSFAVPPLPKERKKGGRPKKVGS